MKDLGSLRVGNWFRYNGNLCIVASAALPCNATCVVYDRNGIYRCTANIHQDEEVNDLGRDLNIALQGAA